MAPHPSRSGEPYGFTADYYESVWRVAIHTTLYALYNISPLHFIAPKDPPAIGWVVRMIAKMGGHTGRKNDGFPGTQTIWRGLAKLYGATQMYAIFAQQSFHPLFSGP